MLTQTVESKDYDFLNSINDNIRSGIPTAIFGVTSTAKALETTLLKESVLYVAKDILSAERIATLITQLSGIDCPVLYPKDDVLLYKRAFSKYSLYKRLSSIYKIKNGARIVCTTFQALAQLLPDKLPTVVFNRGGEGNVDDVLKKLIYLGYTRMDYVSGQGTFSLRGDILDVFPINSENPYRIDYFGDEIETIWQFDQSTREKILSVDTLEVISATDCFATQEETLGINEILDEELKSVKNAEAYATAKALISEIKEMIAISDGNALSFVMPLLKNVSNSILDFMPKDTVVIFDEPKFINDEADNLYKEHDERLKSLFLSGEAFEFSSAQYLDKDFVISRLTSNRVLAMQTFTTAIPFFSPLKTYSLRVTPVTRYQLKFDDFIHDVINWAYDGYKVIVSTGSETKSNDLLMQFAEKGVKASITDDAFYDGVSINDEVLDEGVILHDAKLVLIGSGDLYNRKATKKVSRKTAEFFSAPEVGDYAVHETHGIGKVIGTKKISTTEGTKDYLALEYAGGDVLYVCVEQMDTLTRYLGSDKEPHLSRIGGVEFDRVKQRVKDSIKKLSFDLKELYNERSKNCGFAFEEDVEMQGLFEDAFPYEETPDQLSAIEDIKNDMCCEKVMDRLLCGDVGFGKTEVALRAIFRCVSQGKQAALLAPTTILSEQHYNTAVKRFEPFGIKVESLNRFKTPEQQKKILEKLANGEIEFIIGTHRLLSKDVKFKDLGLLVLDEEQRFGVEHKEKLKLIKKNVDTLTMTATPIPRTLHMSLTGIRDISTINTPPKERIPVSTYVTEENDALIKDAIMRELSRGGQTFILYNRVETIYQFANKVKNLVGDAKITVVHGQLDENELEEKITAFYKGESDVLISTTIIENGIDLPKANTIIVIDADKLGLSTLYQLKGRVGRGNRLAYAYFTFKEQKVLSEEAYKRLHALMEFTEMGSGFKVAMRDLEIRGAGNVMGKEQHGHMDKIGYELYSKLLKEEMTGIKEVGAIELDVRVNAYIPEEYIPSPMGRMDAYKAIAEMNSVKEFNELKNSFLDLYGEIPLEVINLFRISVVKHIASRVGVKKVVVTKDRCSLVFSSLEDFNNGKLMDAVEMFKEECRVDLSVLYEIVFNQKARNNVEMLKVLSKFLQTVQPYGKN